MERVICLAAGYLFGLFQTGYLYGRMHSIDIRKYGSGNSGTTNALRVLGVKAGVIVFLGDLLKTVIPCVLARVLFGGRPDTVYLMILYTGFGVILGHNYPFYMNFRGGKGIAATAGLIASLDWRLILACLVVFVVSVAATRYVSLGSCLVAIVFLTVNVWLAHAGVYHLGSEHLYEFDIVAAVISAMAIWKHRANLVRLMRGTENKLGTKKE